MSLIVKNIVKTYEKGKVLALDNVSFEVKQGERFGIIGPDGAGKTSLFRILTTLLLADSGEASVCGNDVVADFDKIRRISGYMPGKFSLYQDLSVEENLNFFATVFGTTVAENKHLIQDIYVQIEPFKDRPAGKLSGGMKQKLALCCALIHEPKILFLDEPTTGVDPVSRKEFWDMLDRLKNRNITILVSTPYMDEASRCDRIALMQTGKILAIDTLDNITGSYKNKVFGVETKHMHQLSQFFKTHDAVHSCYPFGDTLHVTPKDALLKATELEASCKLEGFHDVVIYDLTPNIEDIFMNLMGQNNGK
ncbi:MAG TPA: ABC transporter ATP-binding protein [Saprospiraceae bacterium]|nr:ABC transporter ATP-binding protein [Saprospiraceae bacterium]